MSDDDDFWKKQVSELGPGLFRYFRANFEGPLASDLVQECLIRLVMKHRDGTFDPLKGSTKSFAYGIARMMRLEKFREKKDFLLLDDPTELNNAADPSSETNLDQLHLLRTAIRQLKGLEQEIILLSIDAEMTLTEIAAHFDLPLNTVKSHVHRAKSNLKEIMETNNGQ